MYYSVVTLLTPLVVHGQPGVSVINLGFCIANYEILWTIKDDNKHLTKLVMNVDK